MVSGEGGQEPECTPSRSGPVNLGHRVNVLLGDNGRKYELRTSTVQNECHNIGLTRGLWWFLLFNVLVFKFFCAVGALCMLSYFS